MFSPKQFYIWLLLTISIKIWWQIDNIHFTVFLISTRKTYKGKSMVIHENVCFFHFSLYDLVILSKLSTPLVVKGLSFFLVLSSAHFNTFVQIVHEHNMLYVSPSPPLKGFWKCENDYIVWQCLRFPLKRILPCREYSYVCPLLCVHSTWIKFAQTEQMTTEKASQLLLSHSLLVR